MPISELHPAFVLHYRKYRDTSLILDLFTRDFGKYSAVARGAQGERSRLKGTLQPFVPLLVSCFGRGELKTLRNVEVSGPPIALQGERLLVGLYVNELLNRLTGRYDAMEELYRHYEESLLALGRGAEVEPELRRFEIALLAQLGYGISFAEEESGRGIERGRYYLYRSGQGFVQVAEGGSSEGAFAGEDLLEIAQDDFTRPRARLAAKRVTRLAIHPLLEGKPLNSRRLFRGRTAAFDDEDPTG